ncbi:uncharacterized protein [Miscanthus floridulus]|uniref:uncharacterized protein n=1 Tax=Miscanthus floridulus TaxID=154761 RepID=UPI003458DCEB
MPRNGSPLRGRRWCPAVVRRNFHFWAVRTYGLDAVSEILGARVYLPSPARIPSHSLGTDKPRAASLCSSFPREGKGSNRYYLRLLPAPREGKFFDVHRPFRKILDFAMAEDATERRIPKGAARKHIAGRLPGSDLLIIVTLFSLLLVSKENGNSRLETDGLFGNSFDGEGTTYL